MHRQQPQPYYGAGAGRDNYGYDNDDNYSYPPPTGSSHNEKGYAAGGLESPEFLRQPSTASSSTNTSTYDEKKGHGTAGQVVPVTSHDPDYIPPAIPRYPNGRPGVGSHHPKSSVSFQPGHVSRGSVALLAAAEGKIPKKEGLKMWRSDEHHGTFTQGGKRRTCVRCCCCTIIFAIILVAGIVAAFLLWVRVPLRCLALLARAVQARAYRGLTRILQRCTRRSARQTSSSKASSRHKTAPNSSSSKGAAST